MELPHGWQSRAQHHRTYWRIRAVGARALFALRAALFRVRGWARAARETGSILYSFGRIVTLTSLAAATLLFLLTTVEHLLLAQPDRLPGIWLRAAHAAAHFETLNAILLTLLQVVGIFLGLYFTAVSVVASTVYASLQADIRNLLTREKIGNLYLKLIIFLGVLTVGILSAVATGHQIGIVAYSFAIALGIISIVSFVPLGNRVFHFFDPTSLVELYILPEILDWIRKASPKGFAWRDASFQAHYQRQAEALLETYTDIIRFAITRHHLRERPLVRLASRCLQLLQHYAIVKSKIPTDSFWFKRTVRYKGWFEVGADQADFALQASTALMHESIPDPRWFEDRVFTITGMALGTFLSNRDYKSVVALSEQVREVHFAQARNFDTSAALQVCRAYQASILEHLVAVAYEPKDGGQPDRSFRLACADYHGLLLATIVVEFANALRDAGDFGIGALAAVAPHKWRRRAPAQIPAAFMHELDRIGEQLSWERSVEGRHLSPAWYVSQLFALSVLRSIRDALEAIVEECVTAYVEERETIAQRLSPAVAAQVVQRGFEVRTKAAKLLEVAVERTTRLDELRRVADIPWIEVDWPKLESKIEQLQDCLLDLLCLMSPRVAELQRTAETPDYFGEMYWRLAEECVDALRQERNERFERLFPTYFGVAQSAMQRLQSTGELPSDYLWVYVSDIVIDLLEMSGLALLYSELRGSGEWSYCRAWWDQHLAQVESPQAVLTAVVASVEFRTSAFTLSPRAMVRTKWEQALLHVLRREGIAREPFAYGKRRTRRPQHQSAILRAFGSHGGGWIRPHDVFLAVYVRARPEAENLNLGARVRDFLRSVDREASVEDQDGEAPEFPADPL